MKKFYLILAYGMFLAGSVATVYSALPTYPRLFATEVEYGEVTTIDATQTVVVQSFSLFDNSVNHVRGVVMARDPNNDLVKVWDLAALVERTGGADAEVVGSVLNLITSQGDSGAALWSATLTVSGTRVRISGTGAIGTTINWAGKLEVTGDTE